MKEKNLYTQGDVNRIFEHIPSRTLLFWASAGLVQWVDERQDGRGRHRFYDIYGLYQLGLIEELSRLNFDIETIKNWMGIFHPPYNVAYWEQPYTFVLGKNNPMTKPEEYQERRADGSKTIISYKAPGWPIATCVPGDRWHDNRMVELNFPDAYIIIAIHLKIVVGKVNRYIDRALE